MEQSRTPPLLFHIFQGRGESLRDYEMVVGLMACTTTAKGLRVTCRLDCCRDTPGRKITAEQMASLYLPSGSLHGEWNYVILPAKRKL